MTDEKAIAGSAEVSESSNLDKARDTGEKIRAKIAEQIARHDRTPFQDMLSTAVSVGPSPTAWKKLAARDPEKYVRAVDRLRGAAGYIDRTEHVHVKTTPKELAQTLVARHGIDKAEQMLTLHGLPLSLLDDLRPPESAQDASKDTHVLNGEYQEISPENDTDTAQDT